MRDLITLTGMVIKSADYAEFDRRITLLTDDRGKITVFVHGARRVNSAFLATTELFAFGRFTLTEGKSAYNMIKADISNYFEELRSDPESFFLASFFLELADYYARENNDDIELLKLLYQSVRALVSKRFEPDLVKSVYQIKAIVVNGEFPGLPSDRHFSAGVRHAVEHVVSSPIEKLYTFRLEEEVLKDFSRLSDEYVSGLINRKFKSLDIVGIRSS